MSESPVEFIPWDEFRIQFSNVFGFDFTDIDGVESAFLKMGRKIDWSRIKNWEDLEDTQILIYLSNMQEFRGRLIVITEAAYTQSNGPFEICGDYIKEFPDFHLTKFGECMFNGDVVILCLNSRSIWLFSHEGAFAYSELN